MDRHFSDLFFFKSNYNVIAARYIGLLPFIINHEGGLKRG